MVEQSDNTGKISENAGASAQNITDLEKSMINNLLSQLSSGTMDTAQKSSMITNIRSLTEAKVNLLKEVANRNRFMHDNIRYDTISLREQANAVEIIERELIRIEIELDKLRDEQQQKKRNTQMNLYYSKSYIAHVELVKLIIILIFSVLAIRIINKLYPIPQMILYICYAIVVLIGLVMILFKFYDISRRDNLDYDKYNWNFDPTSILNAAAADAAEEVADATEITTPSSSSGKCEGADCCDIATTEWNAYTRQCDKKSSVFVKSLGKVFNFDK
jgi:hypothetical protein